eukprot:119709-Chlamydomonas_euryale.AAC.2
MDGRDIACSALCTPMQPNEPAGAPKTVAGRASNRPHHNTKPPPPSSAAQHTRDHAHSLPTWTGGTRRAPSNHSTPPPSLESATHPRARPERRQAVAHHDGGLLRVGPFDRGVQLVKVLTRHRVVDAVVTVALRGAQPHVRLRQRARPAHEEAGEGVGRCVVPSQVSSSNRAPDMRMQAWQRDWVAASCAAT